METCNCAHEQQVRHLKSRVSQLEIMLDKALKRLNVTTQATTAQQNIARPPIHRLTSAELRKAEDVQKRLIADLETERKVKADLMANLKQVTTASESAQAQMARELNETISQRDRANSEIEEFQEEFEALRSKFNIRLSVVPEDGITQLDDESQDKEAPSSPSNSIDQDARLSPSLLRSFASQIESAQERRIRKVLISIAQHCPADMINSVSECDSESLEMQISEVIDAISARCMTTTQHKQLQDVAQLSETIDTPPTTTNTDEVLSAVVQRVGRLVETRDRCMDVMYKTVPATLQDIFTLLNRTSSFTFPERPSQADTFSKDAYETYLSNTDASLSHTIRKYITSHQKSRQKISYRAFTAGDLALFLPTRNANSPAWAAFNVGAPHYFLAMEGVDTQGKDFLIGRIQDITEKDGEPGLDTSPSSGVNPGQVVRKWWEVKILEKKKAVA